MSRTYLFAPVRSIIGRGSSLEIGDVVAPLAQRAFVLGGRQALRAADEAVSSLARRLDSVRVRPFTGECTEDAIAKAAGEARRADLFVGIGGGKAIDTAKAAAEVLGVPCVTLPTSAATCAAYTPLAILHAESGAYRESRRLSQPVEAMIIDFDLIMTAPPRLLSSGIVDALARGFDTLLASRNGVPTVSAGLSLAACRVLLDDVLFPLGEEAVSDNARGEVTDAYSRVVEACILGAGLAGETGARFFGRSFSHAVGYALSHVVDPTVVLHGEAVGLGILVQCALDPDAPVPLEEMLGWYGRWGVPGSFSAVGIRGIDGAEGGKLAERALGYLDLERAVPFPVDAESLHRAMLRIESGDPGPA